MKKFRVGGALVFVAATAFALAGLQDYTLKHTAKADEVFKYKMSGEMNVMSTTVQMSAIMTNKTTKVESNGNYVVESTMSDFKIIINGSETEMGEQKSTVTTYKPDGSVIDVKIDGEDSPEGTRMAILTGFVISEKPLKVGDSWNSTAKGASGKFTFEAVEKVDEVDTARVNYEVKETAGDAPATISGKAWIDVKTGNPRKVESTWKNVPVPGAPTPVDGKMTMTLIP